MRTLAIGDIHGFPTALETLVDFVGARDANLDGRLVFLGDYIDRGPDTRGVIEQLIQLSSNPNNVFLRGNHDEWLLRARFEKRWFKSWLGEGVGGKATLRSYEAPTSGIGGISIPALGLNSYTQDALQSIPATHWDFLENTDYYFETSDHIFVHASIGWEAPKDNTPDQLLWPTFDSINPHPSGKRIVCGHTSQLNALPNDQGFAVCIDTFCSGAAWLSAFDVDTNEVFQVNEEGETRRFLLGERLEEEIQD